MSEQNGGTEQKRVRKKNRFFLLDENRKVCQEFDKFNDCVDYLLGQGIDPTTAEIIRGIRLDVKPVRFRGA